MCGGLEGAAHAEGEDRADQLARMLLERDRGDVAATRIDHAVELVAAVVEVERLEAQLEPRDVLVLDEQRRIRALPASVGLGDEIVPAEMVEIESSTPGDGRIGDVVPQVE